MEWLNSVVFMMDYIQFTFNGPIISFFDPPSIVSRDSVLRWDDAGYRDALCGLITHRVIETNLCDGGNAVDFVFDTGVIVRISASDEVELSGFAGE